MKQLVFIALILCSIGATAQVMQANNSNTIMRRAVHDSGFRLPNVSALPIRPNLLNLSTSNAKGALVYCTCLADTTAKGVYSWTGTAWEKVGSGSSSGWSLTGNTGTNAEVNFIGTIDELPLVVRTNNAERMRILSDGKVGIGTATPDQLFVVKQTAEDQLSYSAQNGLEITNNWDWFDYPRVRFVERWFEKQGNIALTQDGLQYNADGHYFNSPIYFGYGPQNISQGSFDNGTGGNNGISLNCAVGYEFNWQGGKATVKQGGTTVPFELNSPLKIVDGSQGAGKVLTSDASGLASWETPGGGGSLPSQSGNSGKYLTTNGSTPSWAVGTNVNFFNTNLNLRDTGRIHTINNGQIRIVGTDSVTNEGVVFALESLTDFGATFQLYTMDPFNTRLTGIQSHQGYVDVFALNGVDYNSYTRTEESNILMKSPTVNLLANNLKLNSTDSTYLKSVDILDIGAARSYSPTTTSTAKYKSVLMDSTTGALVTVEPKYLLNTGAAAPSSSTDTGTAGEIRITASYIYVCTATNTWVRSALSSW